MEIQQLWIFQTPIIFACVRVCDRHIAAPDARDRTKSSPWQHEHGSMLMSRMNKTNSLITIFFSFWVQKKRLKTWAFKGLFHHHKPPVVLREQTQIAGFVINMLKVFRFVGSKRQITPIYKYLQPLCSIFNRLFFPDHLWVETPPKLASPCKYVASGNWTSTPAAWFCVTC